MTTEELREIDLRVAKALGGVISETAPYWYGVETKAWTPIPKFSTKAAAADWVRLEIERRGWDLETSNSRTQLYYAEVIVPSGNMHVSPDCYDAQSVQSPHHALCVAFLAAVEAEKASVTP